MLSADVVAVLDVVTLAYFAGVSLLIGPFRGYEYE